MNSSRVSSTGSDGPSVDSSRFACVKTSLEYSAAVREYGMLTVSFKPDEYPMTRVGKRDKHSALLDRMRSPFSLISVNTIDLDAELSMRIRTGLCGPRLRISYS